MQLLLAITGASGAIYGIRLLELLLQNGHSVTLVASEAGRQVCLHETGVDPAEPEQLRPLAGGSIDRLAIRRPDDLFAPEASGSAAPDRMLITPCSMGTAARIAAGISGNLIERAADVMIKERRPLLLLPRETPLSTIHLQNLLSLSKLGVQIIPAMPGFYQRPETLQELVDFMVGRVLDQLGVEHRLYCRWGGGKTGELLAHFTGQAAAHPADPPLQPA